MRLAPIARMTRALAWMMLAAALACAAPVRAADDAGKQLYLRYCGACHGPDARGDGIAGTFMRPKPPDLTTLAERNQGEFPAGKLASYIDGTTAVGAHGSSEMPVWGEVLRERPGTTAGDARAKIAAIVAWLHSVQRK